MVIRICRKSAVHFHFMSQWNFLFFFLMIQKLLSETICTLSKLSVIKNLSNNTEWVFQILIIAHEDCNNEYYVINIKWSVKFLHIYSSNVIIIVEVYTGDHFVINLGFWKTSEQEAHVMVEIKQIYHLKPTKIGFQMCMLYFLSTLCVLVVILTFVCDAGWKYLICFWRKFIIFYSFWVHSFLVVKNLILVIWTHNGFSVASRLKKRMSVAVLFHKYKVHSPFHCKIREFYPNPISS